MFSYSYTTRVVDGIRYRTRNRSDAGFTETFDSEKPTGFETIDEHLRLFFRYFHDRRKSIGQITYAGRNPHIAIFLDVKDDSGKVTTWAIEHSNVSQLARLGYSKTTLRPGMEVTAVVNPGAKGEPIGLCQKFVLADGKEIFLRDALPA